MVSPVTDWFVAVRLVERSRETPMRAPVNVVADGIDKDKSVPDVLADSISNWSLCWMVVPVPSSLIEAAPVPE